MSTVAPTPRPSPATPLRAAPAPKVSKLGAVTTGLVREAKRFFFYGTRGVGKSTLAADIPGAIFFDIDHGSGALPVSRYPLGVDPTYQDILDAIDDLATAPHDYKALVIDEASKLESLLWAYVVSREGPDKNGDRPTNIEEVGGGFQKGYVVAEGEWRNFLARLDALRVKRGMHIVILGHSVIATTKNVGGEDFHRHAAKVNAKAADVIGGNADVIGFLTFDDIAKRQGRNKTVGVTGRRVIHLEHSATWDAKSRLPLPPMIDLPESSPWAPFAAALAELYSMTPDDLRASIEKELTRLGADFIRENGTASTAAGVREAVAKAGNNTADLHRYLTTLQQSTPAPVATEEKPQ
jgi:hypothetical protein